MQICTVNVDGTVEISLEHCSDYILSTDELPLSLTTIATDQGTTNPDTTGVNVGTDNTLQSADTVNISSVKTGDSTPICLLIIALCISMAAFFVISTKKTIRE